MNLDTKTKPRNTADTCFARNEGTTSSSQWKEGVRPFDWSFTFRYLYIIIKCFETIHEPFRFRWLSSWLYFCEFKCYTRIYIWCSENCIPKPLHAYFQEENDFRLRWNTCCQHSGINACCECDKGCWSYCHFYMAKYSRRFTGRVPKTRRGKGFKKRLDRFWSPTARKNGDDLRIRSYHRLRNKTINS